MMTEFEAEGEIASYKSLSSGYSVDEGLWRGGIQTRSLSVGVCNAARVNTGKDKGLAKQLVVSNPKRKMDEHITVTIQFYYTVTGGVPGVEDVMSSILDMEEMLAKCTWSGKIDGSDNLSDPKAWSGNLDSAGASFMVKKSVDPNQAFPT